MGKSITKVSKRDMKRASRDIHKWLLTVVDMTTGKHHTVTLMAHDRDDAVASHNESRAVPDLVTLAVPA